MTVYQVSLAGMLLSPDNKRPVWLLNNKHPRPLPRHLAAALRAANKGNLHKAYRYALKFQQEGVTPWPLRPKGR